MKWEQKNISLSSVLTVFSSSDVQLTRDFQYLSTITPWGEVVVVVEVSVVH